MDRSAAPRSVLRLFAAYAFLSLLPVVALGAVLVGSLQREARQRGIDAGRAQAVLVADAAIEPLLDGHPLDEGLTPGEQQRLARLVRHGMRQSGVVRLRLRDTRGLVVFSDDGSGFAGEPDDEAQEAARGETLVAVTRLNEDANDHGPLGERAVEAYQPLYGDDPTRAVGVLELYLPYAPIDQDLTEGLHRLYRDLAVGLAMLWTAGFAVSFTVSRGLRRQLRLNRYLAEHDALSGLPNRVQFHALAGRAVADGDVAIALVDLDRFKEINDTIGHHNGDAVLVEVGHNIAAALGAGDVVARLGGDEFGIVLRHATDVEEVAARLRGFTRHDVELDGLPLSIEASIGFVVAPEDGQDVDHLLQRADVAMYVAKAGHAGVVRYDAGQDHYDTANLELLAAFRRGVAAGELVLHYQPKEGVADGRVRAVEALVRWNHPTRGLLYPDAFIPLVEPTDLVDDLTDAVLLRALGDVRSLGDDVSVAVNISARNLARPDFGARVVGMLHDADVPAGRLVVEVTETALLTDPERATTQLRELHDAGVRVSIDDFGQGQTALSYLATLPVDELKVDRSFVSDMLQDAAHGAIVRSVVDLGHNLGLQVVAEGVETADVAHALDSYGCDVLQGYLVARPMPLDALVDWLSHRVLAVTQ